MSAHERPSRKKTPTARYTAWYGLRMLAASRNIVLSSQDAAKGSTADVISRHKLLPDAGVTASTVTDSRQDLDEFPDAANSSTMADVDNHHELVTDADVTAITVTDSCQDLDDFPDAAESSTMADVDSRHELVPDAGVTASTVIDSCQNLDDLPDDADSVPAHSTRPVLSRAQRLQRRKRNALRKQMLSFEAPEKPTVFKRLILNYDLSDEDDNGDMISELTTTVSSQKCSRKRQRNESGWMRNVIKRARETGSSYISHRGEFVAGKHVPVDECLCHEKCRMKCNERIDNTARQQVFDSFYKLNSAAQDVHLFQCILSQKPKLSVNNATNHRQVSIDYSVIIDGSRVKVCKTAFSHLHGVKKGKLNHIVAQHKAGLTTARPSKRGKHVIRPNKISDDRREFVRAHIRSYPTDMSHYSRTSNPHRLYLASTLSVNSMYQMYVEKCQSESQIPVSSAMYRTIFVTDFNLGFGSPKSDTCSRCETIGDDAMLKQHQEMADRAFAAQRDDKAKAGMGKKICIAFDMEKTLPLPKLTVGDAFYLRQLWLYNLGVHVISNKVDEPHFHIWTENEGHRGVNEVCSSLLAFFNGTKIGDEDSKLVAWSDSCGGQNKNHMMICFWQYMIYCKRFRSIDHKFPEPGHSYLDCDRDFGHVESAVKRHGAIYSVDEYQSIMLQTVRKPKPTVTRMGDKLFDIHKMCKSLNLLKPTVDTCGTKIELRDKVRWIRVTKFGWFQYKHSLTKEEPFKTVRLLRTGPDILPNPTMELIPMQSVAIKKAKLDDIVKQLKFIPVLYHGLYLSLRASDSAADVAEQPREPQPEV